MVNVALLVRLEAKPGKEEEVENFLRGGLAIVQEEPATTAWFAIRLGPTTFGIFERVEDYCATAFVYTAEPQAVPRVDVAAAVADIGRAAFESADPMEAFIG